MKRRTLYVVLMVCCIVALCACSSGSSRQKKAAAPAAPAFTLDKAYHALLVEDVEMVVSLRGHYPLAAGQLEAAMLAQLQTKSAFTEVGKARAVALTADTLIVDANISDMRIVSGAARFWGGAMAGSSYINVHLELKDAVSGQVLHTKELSSANNAFGAAWTGGSTDKSLPGDMGRITAEYIYSVMPK